jgi:xanthine dehydrogenase YagS FAD-binding subunit
MMPFAYTRAGTPEEAIEAIERYPAARFIAGGTNIIDLMREDVEHAELLVDVNALALNAIEVRGEALLIGATARLSDVARHDFVRKHFPLVSIALEESASPQVRNMASIGGNLLQHTRCQYFRDVSQPCNRRRPGSGCGAIGGTNRKEAVLGTSEHCIATHPSDLAVALAALDATVHVRGPAGPRKIPLRDFYRLPGDTPHIETVLERSELIEAVALPLLMFSARSTYVKVRDREQFEFALASAAVALDAVYGRIVDARMALGGVGTIPWRSPAAEASLRGAPLTRESFERAAAIAVTGARGYGENEYKIALAQRTLVRALEETAAMT